MKKYNKTAPEGSRDLLFEECIALSKTTEKIQKVLQKRNYNPVITPGFEFLDLFSLQGNMLHSEDMFKTIDNKGRILCARSDSTLPIARMVSSRLRGEQLPIRLYYSQPVYRIVPALSGRSNEVYQIGTELLGAEGKDADLEVLSAAIESVQSVLSGFRIEIGHSGFIKAFINRLNATPEQKQSITDACQSKNYSALTEILDGLEASEESLALRKVTRLFGGEEVFEKARKLCRGYDEKYALEYLEDLYGTLKKQNLHTNIIIDLGQVLKTDYYSGMVFSGYADGHGDAIITGGRYDRLMEAFDMPMGAAGFAVDVSAVTQIVLGGKTKSSKDNNAAPIRIALTKGRLEKDTVALFKQLDYNVDEIENKGRKLILKVSKGDRVFEIVLAKAPDVITYVENGVCDLGVVGKDTILENGTIFYELYDLGFGRCRFALASKVGEDFYAGYNIKTIATKYPVVARKFFESKNMDVKIIKIEGSVELAPLVGLADAIVDIVETGSTLKENGLEVIEEITPISARLISNIASLKLRKNEIEAFVDEIVGVLK